MTLAWMFLWALVIFTMYKIIDGFFFKPAREAKRETESTKRINGMILKALVDADVDSCKIGEVTKIMASKEAKGD